MTLAEEVQEEGAYKPGSPPLLSEPWTVRDKQSAQVVVSQEARTLDFAEFTGESPVNRMRAWCVKEKSGPSGLVIEDTQIPSPGPREVLVRIRARALNRADLLQSQGRYPAPSSDPEIPGLEFSGEVAARGEGAGAFEIGAPVLGLCAEGAFAEFIALHEDLLLPYPSDRNLVVAAGIPEAALTVFDALVRQAGLKAGKTVFCPAGASGIGTMAIKMAQALGAPIAVATSTRKFDALCGLGADLVLDQDQEDVADRVLTWTEDRGVDCILDLLGGGAARETLRMAAPRSTIVTIGLLAGARGEVDFAQLLMRRITWKGSVLRSRSLNEKIELVSAFREHMGRHLAVGALDPHVDSQIRFEDLPAGLERMKARAHTGKIIVI